MFATRSAAATALALTLLAGCSKPAASVQGAGGGATAPTPTKPASGPDIIITSADLPRPRAGMWEITEVMNGRTHTMRNCESGRPFAPRELGKGCLKFEFKRSFLGAISIDASCQMHGVSSQMHATASGDFNSDFTTDTEGSFSIGGRPAQTISSHAEHRYIGPCAARGDN
ncbi:MAG: DUF3617 domain-containing protein [Caulobacterales bacterium]